MIVPTAFIIVSLLFGILILSFGITSTIKLRMISKNYKPTVGYLVDYSLYSKGSYNIAGTMQTSASYRLIYNYNVAGQKYTISTDYGTSSIPELGSTREIKYNSNNPKRSYYPWT